MPDNAKNPQYQWYSKANSTSAGVEIEGATNASYLPTITKDGDYYYYVVVTVTLVDETTEEETKTELTGNVLIKITSTADTPAETQFIIGSERIHYVRGVGGTGSFMFRTGGNADASPDADVRYIDLLMGEMGCNILRIMVQDDYENYITNSVQSRNSNVFYHNARDNFFPVIRRVNEYGGYVFANPWTGPAYLKSNVKDDGSGGILSTNGSNYVEYAEWLREFLIWLNDNKAPIFALGICNEPDYGAGADYEGMGITSAIHRDWFKTVGHFTTQQVTNPSGADWNGGSIFKTNIIPGYGGGGKTHHVLVMTGDNMGDPTYYNNTINDAVSNQNFELLGRHWYAGSAARITALAGTGPSAANRNGTLWEDRPTGAGGYEGPFEAESIRMSPQMYAPGSTPGNIKREIWQTEHDFNYEQASTNIPGTNPQRQWSSAFAAMNDVDWAMRVVHESVFDWWFSSSYSGLVTSYQGTPVNGNGQQSGINAGATPWPAYTYTPRGRAFAHYARYVNETWSLPINQTKTKTGTNMEFNRTGVATTSFNAGAVDPKISAFEDVNGKFISIVMFTPNASTATGASASSSGVIGNSFGQGGLYGTNDPTRLSANVGRVEVVLPDSFTASSASALRSYGWENATGEEWDDVPTGTPRYWINEPVFLYKTTDGKWAVEVTLPGGNIISIMVKGSWSGSREFASPERVRPYTVN
jgi:hypothetical protein